MGNNKNEWKRLYNKKGILVYKDMTLITVELYSEKKSTMIYIIRDLSLINPNIKIIWADREGGPSQFPH